MKTEKPASVLVCVTDQPSCRRLILAGVEIAKTYGASVQVVSIQPEGLVSPLTANALQNLYDVSSSLGAEMTVYFNNEPALTAAVHAQQNRSHSSGQRHPRCRQQPVYRDHQKAAAGIAPVHCGRGRPYGDISRLPRRFPFRCQRNRSLLIFAVNSLGCLWKYMLSLLYILFL